MDSARALIARGWGVSLVSRCLRVSRAQLHVILRRTDDWKDGRRSRHSEDTDVLLRIHHVDIRLSAEHTSGSPQTSQSSHQRGCEHLKYLQRYIYAQHP